MESTGQTAVDCLKRIPKPVEVKRRLAKTYREASLLRQLLRVAEKKHGKFGSNRSDVQETELR